MKRTIFLVMLVSSVAVSQSTYLSVDSVKATFYGNGSNLTGIGSSSYSAGDSPVFGFVTASYVQTTGLRTYGDSSIGCSDNGNNVYIANATNINAEANGGYLGILKGRYFEGYGRNGYFDIGEGGYPQIIGTGATNFYTKVTCNSGLTVTGGDIIGNANSASKIWIGNDYANITTIRGTFSNGSIDLAFVTSTIYSFTFEPISNIAGITHSNATIAIKYVTYMISTAIWASKTIVTGISENCNTDFISSLSITKTNSPPDKDSNAYFWSLADVEHFDSGYTQVVADVTGNIGSPPAITSLNISSESITYQSGYTNVSGIIPIQAKIIWK